MRSFLKSKQNKGFTLVETMVAISILMLAILGPLSIVSAGLRNAFQARDQITAYYLAQEGIEYVRSTRDYNYLTTIGGTPQDWLYNLNNCRSSDGVGCIIDTPIWFSEGSGVVTSCTGGGGACTNSTLYFDEEGRYTHSAGIGSVLTNYGRYVTITPIGDNYETEVTITSTVTWKGATGQKTFVLSEQLFNLYKP